MKFPCRSACDRDDWSLSSRRAWIEIYVARNPCPPPRGSLSSRRAWIEMLDYEFEKTKDGVALLTEGVD